MSHYERPCEVCDQTVTDTGPWCDLYCQEKRVICFSLAHEQLKRADATGDGPMVNALCEYGRRHFGPCLHW
jgi:hypothetical protein